jgi:hypothetical protein
MSFFPRPEQPESDIDLYNRLKQFSRKEIKAELDTIFKIRGAQHLYKVLTNSLLDIEREGLSTNPNIQFIESYSLQLLNKEGRGKALAEVLKTLEGRLIAIGSFGLFLLELTKYVLSFWIKK